jgi:ribose/xylose/arabinose/galactoside ABC-type transport system permease subunit
MEADSGVRALVEPQVAQSGMAIEMWLLEAAAAWAVRRALEGAYRAATGRTAPASDDTGLPLRRVIAWTVVTAASVAAADAVVDQLVLRRSRWNRVLRPAPAADGGLAAG